MPIFFFFKTDFDADYFEVSLTDLQYVLQIK